MENDGVDKEVKKNGRNRASLTQATNAVGSEEGKTINDGVVERGGTQVLN